MLFYKKSLTCSVFCTGHQLSNQNALKCYLLSEIKIIKQMYLSKLATSSNEYILLMESLHIMPGDC